MRALTPLVLAVNGGSSSLKFALFTFATSEQVTAGSVPPGTAASRIMAALEPQLQSGTLVGIVHRIVHGGERFDRAHRITAAVMDGLRALIPLAPNHLPGEIALIESFMQARPDIPQVACFDTAFHRDLPEISRTLPVPMAPGLRRYGFHGLSYSFLMSELTRVDAAAASGRVVLAHLGNGASLAAVAGGRCVDTSMGLTPAGGLVMSTRAGDIDPGVIAYMARLRRLSVEQVDDLLTRESGLRAISGGSADMQVLLSQEQTNARARLAVDLFCYQVRKWIGAFAAALGGLETLVFAGGIGEHAPAVRERICRELAFLGVELDEPLNAGNAAVVSTAEARVRVRVIATNEAVMMVTEAHALLREPLQLFE